MRCSQVWSSVRDVSPCRYENTAVTFLRSLARCVFLLLVRWGVCGSVCRSWCRIAWKHVRVWTEGQSVCGTVVRACFGLTVRANSSKQSCVVVVNFISQVSCLSDSAGPVTNCHCVLVGNYKSHNVWKVFNDKTEAKLNCELTTWPSLSEICTIIYLQQSHNAMWCKIIPVSNDAKSCDW